MSEWCHQGYFWFGLGDFLIENMVQKGVIWARKMWISDMWSVHPTTEATVWHTWISQFSYLYSNGAEFCREDQPYVSGCSRTGSERVRAKAADRWCCWTLIICHTAASSLCKGHCPKSIKTPLCSKDTARLGMELFPSCLKYERGNMKIVWYYSQSHVYIYFLCKGHMGQMGFDVQPVCKS